MVRFLLQGKTLLFMSILSVIAFVVYLDSNHQQEDNLPLVVTTKVSSGDLSDTLSFAGTIKPYAEVDISAKTGGYLSSMNVAIGDRVERGKLLASLDGSTDKATVNSLLDNFLAIKQTASAVENLYALRIKSAEESLSLVKQTTATSSSLEQNTKSVSLITNTAILASQVNDTLGEMLSMRNGIRNYKDVAYYNNLGATNFSSRPKAEDSLAKYQSLQSAYQSFFNENILDKKPTNETVSKGLLLSRGLLESAKIALSDSYSMLLYTSLTDVLSQTKLDTYKANVTSLGSQVETTIATIRLTESEIIQTELSLSTLQKEKDSKLAEANAQATQVQGQMSVSQTMVDNSSLRAPFDGVITAKNVDVGGVVGFGVPVYHLVQDDVVKVTIGVPDELSDSFTVGEDGLVYIDDNEDNKIPAKITKIYPAVDPKNNKVTIELEIDNKEHILKVGSIVNVSLPHKNSNNRIVIPKEALVSRYGLSYVFIVKDGVVARKIVGVGMQTDSSVEITYGLSSGDVVVKEGGYYLRSGDKVKVSSSTEYVAQ